MIHVAVNFRNQWVYRWSIEALTARASLRIQEPVRVWLEHFGLREAHCDPLAGEWRVVDHRDGHPPGFLFNAREARIAAMFQLSWLLE